ncbi:MAG: hypothetical protein M3R48_03440, partial [Candidatus Dormibacteraeota bacterium]|nr:hypothetical protein [Candidatus Dormibacteraeota bacterium]
MPRLVMAGYTVRRLARRP